MKISHQTARLPASQATSPAGKPASAAAADPTARLPLDESERQYTWHDTPQEAMAAIPPQNLKHPDGQVLMKAKCADGKTRYRPYDVYRDELKGAGTKLLVAGATWTSTVAAGLAMASSTSSIPLAMLGAGTLGIAGASGVGLVGMLAYVGIRSLMAPPPQ